MKETNFQKILVASFRSCGAIVFNLHGHSMQVAGIPDLYVAHTIWSGWLELKTGTNPLSKLQERTMRGLESTKGINAFVLTERKPKILVKNSYGDILSHIPFISNTIDGTEILGFLSRIPTIVGGLVENGV